MELLEKIKDISEKINNILDLKKEERSELFKEELKSLRYEKRSLEEELIEQARPCNVGDTFSAITFGGRQVKGVVNDFKIFKSEVYIDSYYPIVKGKKLSSLAFFSFPYSNLNILEE